MAKIHYGKLPTEQRNPRSAKIDRLSIPGILNLIHREEASIPKAVAKVKKEIAHGVRLIVTSLQTGGRLFFAGAGTSGRLGVIEAAECPPTFSTPPSLVQGVMAGGKRAVFRSREGAEDRDDEGRTIFSNKLRPGDVLVGIAASGVTPFVHGAFQAARKKGAATILVTCNPRVLNQKLIDCVIAPAVGPEVISGSTRLKAGTATKLVLNQLTVASMIRLGKVYENWMVDLQPKSRKLHARAIRLIQTLGRVSEKQAGIYLEKSRKNVKAAILMARSGLTLAEAKTKLKNASGFLHSILDQ